ncbi:hypothetical protein WICPIJ_004391 [Wickerhamomyces pijperi]|uniref:Uncharacterized protein n=1 Tax=Wickerhamomyces pijperi TaxID=599730 RepID=A0A9P8TMY6_WICPI|nr:hypothetical protein WICPIJ_004391 [Wickerhamomyces pijperi]
MIVCGWILWSTNFSASLNNSADKTVTEVVPSPTSSSWTLEIFTKTLAAGLSKGMDFKMVAPSLVTKAWLDEADCNNLSIPFGPRVDLTKSPTAMAPTKAERRAFSALSSVTWSP